MLQCAKRYDNRGRLTVGMPVVLAGTVLALVVLVTAIGMRRPTPTAVPAPGAESLGRLAAVAGPVAPDMEAGRLTSASGATMVPSAGNGREIAEPLAKQVASLDAILFHCASEDVTRLVREFASTLGESELREIFDYLGASVGFGFVLHPRLIEALILRLAKVDPQTVAEVLIAQPPEALGTDLLGQVVTDWGRDDWASAVAWAKNLPDGGGKDTVLLRLSAFWIQGDVAGAAAYLRSMPAGESRTRMAVTLATQWARRDPHAAVAWLGQLSGEPSPERAMASLVSAWAEHDGRAAAEFVSKLPYGTLPQDVGISLISALAGQQPALAAQWITAFPNANRDYLIENVAYRWAALDPEAAAAWARSLAAGSDRNAAAYAGAAGLIDSRPELAGRWTEGILDTDKRHFQMERVARRWLQVDPQAARVWIAQSDLPASRKAILGF